MSTKSTLLCGFWFAIGAPCPAQESAPGILRFGTFETAIQNDGTYDDPYRDVALRATIKGPYGESFEVDGFYDGGHTWKVRFRADNPGRWNYATRFSDGSPAPNGEFHVRHGTERFAPLQINPVNPIWFRRGVEPFLIRALHVGDRFFAANWSDAERMEFLNWFSQQGYNTISVASHLLNRQENGRGAGWETPRLWPLDAAEYRKMERILDELDRRGIAVFPFAGFFGKNSNYPRAAEDQELYLRYTMARIGHYRNLLYNVAGPEPNLRDSWMSRADVERLGRQIRELDLYGHPLSVHNRPGVDPYRDSDWTTYGVLQGPKTTDRSVLSRGLLESHHPAKPLFAQETLWSGNQFHIRRNGRDYSDDDIRKNAYVINMSAAGLCFADNQGNSSSGFTGSLKLSDRDQRRHDIVKRVWDFFQSVPYFEMKPSQQLVDRGYCLAQHGRRYMVYLESGDAVNVRVDRGPFGVHWINAQDTSDRRDGGITTNGRDLRSPADGDDWLLSLNSTKTGLPDQIHLSWSEDTSSTVTVTWHTVSNKNPALVQYRPMADSDWQETSGTTFASPGDGWLHRATLRGLAPSTEYEYRVSSDLGIQPAMGRIHLTKTGPSATHADFSFAFTTDTGLVGRLDGNATGTQQIIDEIVREGPLLVLGCGDYAYANRDGRFNSVGEAIDEWFEQYEPVLARFPFMSQYGNHEIYLTERFEDWAPRFAHPPGLEDSRCYSFDVADVHFTAFFLVNNLPTDEQLQWLDQDLKSARQAGSRWLVVYHHEPLYGFGRSHPSKLPIARKMIPILERHRVDLHLSSHDQNYERTFPLLGPPDSPRVVSDSPDRYIAGQGVIYCKVSPGGKKSEIGNRFSRFTVPQQPFMAKRHDQSHHYAIVEVRAYGEMQVNVYSVQGDGTPKSLTDRFVIRQP